MIVTIPFTRAYVINGVSSTVLGQRQPAPFLWKPPSDVTSITVECFGGGTNNYYSSVGLRTANGSAYSKSNLSLTSTTNVWISPGNLDTEYLGLGNSWVSLTSNIEPYANTTTTAVKACGGGVPVEFHISKGIGEIKYRGGKSGNTFFVVVDAGGETGLVTTYYRGGAGGAAGPNGNGGNGYPSTSTTLGGGGGANGGSDATGTSGGLGRFANVTGAGGSSGNVGYTEYIRETTVPIVYYPENYLAGTSYNVGTVNPAKDSESREVYVTGGRGGSVNGSVIAGSGYFKEGSPYGTGLLGWGIVLITYTYPKFTAVFGMDNGGLDDQRWFNRNSNYTRQRANTWATFDTWIKLPADIPNVITVECFTGITPDGGGSYSKSNINVSPNQSIYIGGLNKYVNFNCGAFVNTLANTIPTLANGTISGCYAANGNVFTQETRSVGLVTYRGGQSGYQVVYSTAPSGESPGSTYYYYGGRGGQAGPNGRGGHGSPAYISPGGSYYWGAGGGANGGGDASNSTPGVNRFGNYGAGAGSNVFVWPSYPTEKSALKQSEALVYNDTAFGNTTVLVLGGAPGYYSDYSPYEYFGYDTYNKVALSYISAVSGNAQTITYSYAYIIG